MAVIREELREPRRAWIDVTLPTSPPPPPSPHLACETALPHNSILVSASGGETLWFSAFVSPSCVGFFLVRRSCEPSTELELFFPPDFLFPPCFYVKEISFRAATWWERI